VALLIAVVAIEVWVRVSWDERRGTPGFFLSDATLGQRLAPGYEGWFAGVPVRINRLGFRDPREYDPEKAPGTFRILVLGDSVTFGHGAIFETTYPYLLEQRLETWRPDVRWEVWNLGVPGYNTRQELLHLQDVAARYAPDLVIVGFYPNDFTGNEPQPVPGWAQTTASRALRTAQRHFYSLEFYKRVYLSARWALSRDDAFKRRLEHLETESDLAVPVERIVDAPEQKLTSFDSVAEDDVRTFECIGAPPVDESRPGELAERIHARAPDVIPWLDAVERLQQLDRASTYQLVFFINMAPEPCHGQDRFYNGGFLADERILLKVLGNGTPAVSSGSAFLRHRPSQMPLAAGHSLGNSNVVKANVLFEFLRDRVLPSMLAPRGEH
jgi:hypothetical protein